MTTGTDKITRELKARRKALLDSYDDEDLHQLRVNIRRARALLKHHPDKRSPGLRKAWGRIARHTNAARDWDTLALYAAEVLPPEQWRVLQPRVTGYREEACEQVQAILESGEWDKTLGRWKKLTRRGVSDSPAETTVNGDITQAAESALRASRRALAWGDETSWHKLRIAIKNLRYTLDSAPLDEKQGPGDAVALQELCKRLQTELGNWHDTVVHRTLLAQLADDSATADKDRALDALDKLASIIKMRGTDSLRRVEVILDHRGWMLVAAAGES